MLESELDYKMLESKILESKLDYKMQESKVAGLGFLEPRINLRLKYLRSISYAEVRTLEVK